MSRTGRPLPPLKLSAAELQELQRLERRRTTAQALAQWARIVLACAQGRSNTEVARLCRVTRPTVGKWRQRYVERRTDGLLDEPRPGHPRTVSDEDVERVLVQTLGSQPKHATHWSTRLMAQASGLSQSTVTVERSRSVATSSCRGSVGTVFPSPAAGAGVRPASNQTAVPSTVALPNTPSVAAHPRAAASRGPTAIERGFDRSR